MTEQSKNISDPAPKETPLLKGVFLSKNEDNGKEVMIATIRLHMPFDDPAQLALRGCALRIINPTEHIVHPNTILVGGGREKSHADLRNNSRDLTGGYLSTYENPNFVEGFYTFSGFFVPRMMAMWCSLHIEKGLKDDWSRRTSFHELQSRGVVWEVHKKEWDAWQKQLKA